MASNKQWCQFCLWTINEMLSHQLKQQYRKTLTMHKNRITCTSSNIEPSGEACHVIGHVTNLVSSYVHQGTITSAYKPAYHFKSMQISRCQRLKLAGPPFKHYLALTFPLFNSLSLWLWRIQWKKATPVALPQQNLVTISFSPTKKFFTKDIDRAFFIEPNKVEVHKNIKKKKKGKKTRPTPSHLDQQDL